MLNNTRRLAASAAKTGVVIVTMSVLNASAALAAGPTPSPTPNPNDLGSIIDQQKNAGIDYSLISINNWVWKILAAIAGVLIVVIIVKAMIIGAAKVGFSGGKADKVRAGVAEIKYGIMGALGVALGSAIVLGVLSFLIALTN